MNKLEKWDADGVISLQYPENAQNEAEAGGDARRTTKARKSIASMTLISNEEERERLSKIERVIFGDRTLSKQDEIDALNVFEAHKYGRIFITADGKVLQATPRLRELGSLGVITDSSAVEDVRRRIRERDYLARSDAARDGCPLPDWVGKDD